MIININIIYKIKIGKDIIVKPINLAINDSTPRNIRIIKRQPHPPFASIRISISPHLF